MSAMFETNAYVMDDTCVGEGKWNGSVHTSPEETYSQTDRQTDRVDKFGFVELA